MEKIRTHYFAFDPQPVRLLDVFLVGPLMIYAGKKGEFKPIVKNALIGIGVATIAYNGINYYLNESKRS